MIVFWAMEMCFCVIYGHLGDVHTYHNKSHFVEDITLNAHTTSYFQNFQIWFKS